jgi:predicted  nucleic acid-binding Zn-ribbon protein
MHDLHAALIALQEIDAEIDRAEAVVASFTPKLQELNQPIDAAERDMETASAKLDDLRAEVKRLDGNAQQKRERLQSYQDRLAKARTSREEAALRAEIDLVRKALEADQVDLKQTSEQATRADLKLDDIMRNADKVRADTAPQRDELLAARSQAEELVKQLRDRRENQAIRLDPQSRRLYERLRSGRSHVVLAPLTEEGACGACFNILPVQEQAVVRQAKALHRCEACGVILYAA